MYIEVLLRYIHFISIFTIAGMLTAEFFMLQKQTKRAKLAMLAKVDAVYGIASVTLLSAGLTLWLGGYGKPSSWYTNNWIFHLKLGLFTTIGILSIWPTVFFIKQRKGDPQELVTIPSKILLFIRLELLLLFIIPLLAGLMARGIGYF
jgi:putative membrane protein